CPPTRCGTPPSSDCSTRPTMSARRAYIRLKRPSRSRQPPRSRPAYVDAASSTLCGSEQTVGEANRHHRSAITSVRRPSISVLWPCRDEAQRRGLRLVAKRGLSRLSARHELFQAFHILIEPKIEHLLHLQVSEDPPEVHGPTLIV